jgi:hypothetical protein
MWVGVANLFIFMICIFANFEQLLLSSKVVSWVRSNVDQNNTLMASPQRQLSMPFGSKSKCPLLGQAFPNLAGLGPCASWLHTTTITKIAKLHFTSCTIWFQ